VLQALAGQLAVVVIGEDIERGMNLRTSRAAVS
jgi:hypothetical protein